MRATTINPLQPSGRVYGYGRVSTHEQARTSAGSPDEQRRQIRQRAAGLADSELVEIFFDEITGSIPLAERPEGGKLLRQLRRGDCLIIPKLDRGFRDNLDAELTARAFREAGIDLILLDLGPEPVTNAESGAALRFSIMAAYAAFERARLRERVLEGKAAIRAKGYFSGGTPPFGYRVVPEGEHRRLVEDEREQVVLRAIRLKWDQNRPMKRIVRELFVEGHRNRKGGPIHATEVYRWVLKGGDRSNRSERTREIQARRKAEGLRVGNPKIAELSPKGLAQILNDMRQRAAEVAPQIEQAIAGGSATYRTVAVVLNALNVPTARGGRWHASTVRNAMIAADLKFPSKKDRRERGLARPRDVQRLTLAQVAALDAEALAVAQERVKPRLAKVQKQSATILKLYAGGSGQDAISRILGIDARSVRSVLEAAGRGRKRRHQHGSEIEQRRARILALRREEPELTAQQIAARLDGVTDYMVYDALGDAAVLDPELALGSSRMSPDERREVAELRAQDVPVPVIARKLRRSVRSIYRALAMIPDMPGKYIAKPHSRDRWHEPESPAE